ncbi:A/G-specific adenine glycosylase [Aureispira anguillae]|uniref:Adenine DNA glycosylase n=1 Tax=Aureispira anguillae TaxID=2864201 RepID=A0A915YJ53_9BACT|nr:A/G-specific adenine glycosylase [Aureispira anguillae]BDS14144.1 A/G-specific adenine glycosylase [Aureispira anguillae]
MNKIPFFTEKLLDWYQPDERPLPWKAIKNPYFIWLSEIILQQTRVQQGLPYYIKFVEQFPTITDLAGASQDEVFKLWEGLGYYSRARNLHAAAQMVRDDYAGVFPSTYPEIRALKGVGEYTAAAIASFAYDLPYAVVDGNVYRVLSRFFGIDTPIDTTAGKKEFRLRADELLDRNNPAVYNQAIMDFGATHCTPKAPKCETCLHQKQCVAFRENRVMNLPVKSKKIKKRSRYFYYLVLNKGTKIYLNKRSEKDIWADLYDFLLIELEQQVEGLFLMDALQKTSHWKTWFGKQKIVIDSISGIYKQTLSHQNINAIFIEIQLDASFFVENKDLIVIERKKIKNFAFPKIITNYLEAKKA